ncbi:hypothetical protein HDU89_003166 [Geranomyces variabilis]|nr:hypothetical protein HDU89_003166 [Geranomyces variabilis]
MSELDLQALEDLVAANPEAEWDVLHEDWKMEAQQLKANKTLNNTQQRRLARLHFFRNAKQVFFTLKQKQTEQVQKVLKGTEIQGAANQSQSEANASIARAAEKLVDIVLSPVETNKRNRPSDPNDEIRKRVRVLNADPNAELIDSGPLYWGIIDTDDTVAMALLDAGNHQYAKQQIDKALDIEREPVMQFLLSGDSWQKCQSISKAANLLTCGGLRELWAELDGDEALLQDLFASKDAAYLKRCFEDMALYLDQYAGRPVRTERSFDCHAVITLAKVPGRNLAPAIGELMSVADQREKHLRTNDEKRFGKKVDFMYHVQKDEYAVGENSGAETRQHLRHAKEIVIHLAKCARSLSMARKKRVPDCREVIVPFFQILDLKARFYLQFEAADEIFIMHQYQEVSFPQDDGDVLGMLELVEAFLIMRDIIESTAQATTKTRTKRTARRLTTPPRPQLLAGVTTPPTKAASEKKSSTGKKAKGRGGGMDWGT